MITHKDLNLPIATIAFLFAGLIPCNGQSQNPYLAEDSFSFGNVRQGEILEHRFTMNNPDNTSVAVRMMGLSHPGMKIRMPQTLLPGSTGVLTITWDTRLVQGDTTVQALLRFGDNQRVVIKLTAKVVPPVDVLPQPAVFLSGFLGEAATTSLEIVNNDPTPLNITGLSSEKKDVDPGYAATFTTVEPGRKHALNIELKPSAPSGKSQDVLLVLTDSARYPVIRIPVNLFVKEGVYVNPESVDFGVITKEAHDPETFLLKSRDVPIKVLSVSSNLPYVRVTQAENSDAAAPTHEFHVELDNAELRPGLFSGTIFIRTDDPNFSELKIPVQGEVRR